MIGIYKITNLVNSKSYIGQSVHIERRWQEHCSPSAKSIIAKAIQKYGKENFSFEVLEECSCQDLDNLEQYYLNKFQTLVPYGYNVLNVGERPHHSCSIGLFYQAEQVQKDILYSTLTFQEIAEKYYTSTRTITRINQGYTFHNEDLTYPLRLKPCNLTHYIKQRSYCVDCGVEITLNATRCAACDKVFHRKVVDRPSRNELKEEIRNQSFVQIGKKYGVSDNTIRKWCQAYSLPSKKNIIKTLSNEEWLKI